MAVPILPILLLATGAAFAARKKARSRRPTILPKGAAWDNPRAVPLMDAVAGDFFPLAKGDMLVVRTGIGGWADRSGGTGLPEGSVWRPPSGAPVEKTDPNLRIDSKKLERSSGKKLRYTSLGQYGSGYENVTPLEKAVYVITDIDYGDYVPVFNWWRKPGMTKPGYPRQMSWEAALVSGEGAKYFRWTHMNAQMEDKGWAYPGDWDPVKSFSPFTAYESIPQESALKIIRNGKTIWTGEEYQLVPPVE